MIIIILTAGNVFSGSLGNNELRAVDLISGEPFIDRNLIN